MPRRRGYRDWYYDRFSEDEEETEDEAFESIASDVDRIWRSEWWSERICDDESQWGFITAMQKKYMPRQKNSWAVFGTGNAPSA